ncbi:MAG: epoxyqueuosine reductase [Candidatus Aminicenantes bacterium]|nr:epoxyqueuosine reductase [Candidatus Aminicenantes bacterium]
MDALLFPRENAERLKSHAFSLGFSVFGIADVAAVRDEFRLPPDLRKRFSRAVSLARRVMNGVLEDIEDHPTPLYFHHYRQLNFFLDRAAFDLASDIQAAGFLALPVPASQVLDMDKQTAHVSHKKIAVLAGLGHIGRNNLLVHPDFGSRIRLVTVLTDMPLEADRPTGADCGSCRACLSACPAAAIKERPEDFDHRGCFAKLEEFRRLRYVSQHICGICVKACRGSAVRGPLDIHADSNILGIGKGT